MKHSVIVVAVILVIVTGCNGILRRDICRQPIVSGRCFASVPSFAYDAITGRCEEFIYGGCGGNENRFYTLKECEKSCRGV